MSTQLPIELVNQICLFTGKFILLPNGKLKSIIDMRDFTFLGPFLLERRAHVVNTLMRHWNRQEIFNKEQRQKEHLLHMKNVDFKRHRSLFMEEEGIELLAPVQKGLFCFTCLSTLSSIDLEKISRRRFCKYFRYYWSANESNQRCIYCKHARSSSQLSELELSLEERKEKMRKETFEKKIVRYLDKNDSHKKFNKTTPSYHRLR